MMFDKNIATNALNNHAHPVSYSAGLKSEVKCASQTLRVACRTLIRRGDAIADRNQSFVKDEYRSIYSMSTSEWIDSRNRRREIFRENGRYVEADGWYLMGRYNQKLHQWISKLGAKNILEVGSGRGQNAILQAMMAPELKVHGIELTPEGVASSEDLARNIPKAMHEIAGNTTTPKLGEQLTFTQGSGFALPLGDKSVDVSYTVLVLEQIPSDFRKVVQEMKRVSRKACIFIEPFIDGNHLFGKLHLNNKDYFRWKAAELESSGLKIKHLDFALPQKIRFSAGFLVCDPTTN